MVRAAYDRFCENGYTGTTIADVAADLWGRGADRLLRSRRRRHCWARRWAPRSSDSTCGVNRRRVRHRHTAALAHLVGRLPRPDLSRRIGDMPGQRCGDSAPRRTAVARRAGLPRRPESAAHVAASLRGRYDSYRVRQRHRRQATRTQRGRQQAHRPTSWTRCSAATSTRNLADRGWSRPHQPLPAAPAGRRTPRLAQPNEGVVGAPDGPRFAFRLTPQTLHPAARSQFRPRSRGVSLLNRRCRPGPDPDVAGD